MTLLAISESNIQIPIGYIIAFLVIYIISSVRQHSKIRQLEHQIKIIRKKQTGNQPLSQEVAILAKDPKHKIAAIKLHREQNPGLSIADAKWDVESLA